MKYMINDNGVDREMTPDEIEQHKIGIALAERDQANQDAAIEAMSSAKASARAKLAALGLTADEIAAFLG